MISFQMQSVKSPAWIDYFDDDTSLMVKYTTALHWCIGQFSGIDAGIRPMNTSERLFASALTYFALFATAFAASKVTALMIHSAQHEGNRDFHFSLLRKHLAQKRVSMDLTAHIMKNVEIVMQAKTKSVEESDVKYMSFISASLLREIHYETRSPTLCCHPFFYEIASLEIKTMKVLCETCVRVKDIVLEEQLFNTRTGPVDCMFFINQGMVQYKWKEPNPAANSGGVGMVQKMEKCGDGSWFCEGALWFSWTPIGAADVIKNDADVFEIAVQPFRAMAPTLHAIEFLEIKAYARRFLEQISTADSGIPINDLYSIEVFRQQSEVGTGAGTAKSWASMALKRGMTMASLQKRGTPAKRSYYSVRIPHRPPPLRVSTAQACRDEPVRVDRPAPPRSKTAGFS
jgi:hypothetical protein